MNKRKSHYTELMELVKIRFEDYEGKGSIAKNDICMMNMTLEKDDDIDIFTSMLIESGFSVSIVSEDDGFKAKIYKKY